MRIAIHFQNSKQDLHMNFDNCPSLDELVLIGSVNYIVRKVYYTEHRSDESSMTTNIVLEQV